MAQWFASVNVATTYVLGRAVANFAFAIHRFHKYLSLAAGRSIDTHASDVVKVAGRLPFFCAQGVVFVRFAYLVIFTCISMACSPGCRELLSCTLASSSLSAT